MIYTIISAHISVGASDDVNHKPYKEIETMRIIATGIRYSERHYPTCCLSMNCGGSGRDCEKCGNRPVQAEFYAWRDKHEAKQPDPIWCPTLWRGTRVI